MFGDWLDEAIKARKLTQTKIAAACGVSQQAVSHWVKNDRTPAADSLRPLAKALDISADELLERIDDGKVSPRPAGDNPAVADLADLLRRVEALEEQARRGA